MSLSVNGRQVLCDGEGCRARADVPIGLRPMLTPDRTAEAGRIDGWLFTASQGEWRHYCPDCLTLYLESLNHLSSAE